MATKITCTQCGKKIKLEYVWVIHDTDMGAMWCEYDGETARKIADKIIEDTGHNVRCYTINEYKREGEDDGKN